MHRNRNFRGQAATEFLTFASFFLLLFLVLTAVFYNQQSVEISQKQSLLARELASQYADSANFALRAGNSFRGTFNFPTEILGRPYTVTFSNGTSGFAYVSWESPGGAESTYSARLSTGAIQLEPGCNECRIEEVVPGERYLLVFIPNGKMTFINRDGVLYINQ